MRMKITTASALIVLTAWCHAFAETNAAAGNAAADFGGAVRQFSAARHKLAQELSSRLNLPLPPQAEAFFRVAETGNWESVSNSFDQVKQRWGYGPATPQLQNEALGDNT